jgi:hypothetical protein
MVFVDELQDARREVINRSLRPVLSSTRVANPQLWFAGTGERDESDMLRLLRDSSLEPDSDVLWLEWSAPPGCATDDRAAWRWASPDWSESREEALASDRRVMEEREFRSEYLVQHDARVSWWVPEHAVAGCGVDAVRVESPAVAAVEVGLDQQTWAAAVTDGREVTTRVGDFTTVIGWVTAQNPGTVLAHIAVTNRLPGSLPIRAVKTHEVSAAASFLADTVRAGAVRWDNPATMREQFSHVVVAEVDGLRRIVDTRSRGPVNLVKATSWALWWSHQNQPEPPGVF